MIGSRPHIWTQNQTPGKYAQPFRSVGPAPAPAPARGIYAPRCTKTTCASADAPSTQIQMSWCRCSGRRRLTEGRGAEAGHRAGHQGVGDLPEGQQARRVVPLPLLLLDEALQLLFEGLGEEKREVIRQQREDVRGLDKSSEDIDGCRSRQDRREAMCENPPLNKCCLLHKM